MSRQALADPGWRCSVACTSNSMSVVLTPRCRPRASKGLDVFTARLGCGETDKYLEDDMLKAF